MSDEMTGPNCIHIFNRKKVLLGIKKNYKSIFNIIVHLIKNRHKRSSFTTLIWMQKCTVRTHIFCFEGVDSNQTISKFQSYFRECFPILNICILLYSKRAKKKKKILLTIFFLQKGKKTLTDYLPLHTIT